VSNTSCRAPGGPKPQDIVVPLLTRWSLYATARNSKAVVRLAARHRMVSAEREDSPTERAGHHPATRPSACEVLSMYPRRGRAVRLVRTVVRCRRRGS
jgi:hypothetical protein